MKVNLISYRLELIRKSLPGIQERNLLIQLPDANFSEVNKGDHTDAMPIIFAKGTLQQSTTPTAPELFIPSLAPKSSGPRGIAQAPGLGSRGVHRFIWREPVRLESEACKPSTCRVREAAVAADPSRRGSG